MSDVVNPRAVAEAFMPAGEIKTSRRLSDGLINLTFKVQTRGGRAYVLQRLNPEVFPRPVAVMENIRRVTEQLAGHSTWSALRLVQTRVGKDWHLDDQGHVWRCYHYVPHARTYARPPNLRVSYAAARAFGEFAAALGPLDPGQLHVTVAGFHDTPQRLCTLNKVLQEDRLGRARTVAAQADAIARRADTGTLLATAWARGELCERVVHNDTKLNNVLFHYRSAAVLCVVDLDTVMPGLLLHDFGDLVRSAAAVGEGRDVQLDLAHFGALATGYLAGAGGLVSAADLAYLAVAPRVLALELAARFLTDYLEGDRYFAVTRPEENLARCERQLALLTSMERQEAVMRLEVERCLKRPR